MLIYNAKIITMTDKNYDNGFVEIRDGRITAVNDMRCLAAKPAEGDYDAAGRTLYPAFIDAHCHIGVFADGLGFEGEDCNEVTDPVTPQLRAIDAVNPLDKCFCEAAACGIGTVVTGMGSANAIGGTMLAMKTCGGARIESRIVKSPVSMKFALGENPKNCYHDREETPMTRMGTAALIREQLSKARRYYEDMKKYESAPDEEDRPDYDAKCEALLPLLKKEISAHFHCHRADDICTAMRLAEEFDIDYVLIHATEGHLIPEVIKEENAAVVLGPVLCDRSKPELKNHTVRAAGMLYKAGVKFAVCTDHPVTPAQYLPLTAALCVRGGLPREQALKAITVNAAEIAGISDRVGTIEAGKDADICVFDGDPLDIMTTPEAVFISGRRVNGCECE